MGWRIRIPELTQGVANLHVYSAMTFLCHFHFHEASILGLALAPIQAYQSWEGAGQERNERFCGLSDRWNMTLMLSFPYVSLLFFCKDHPPVHSISTGIYEHKLHSVPFLSTLCPFP